MNRNLERIELYQYCTLTPEEMRLLADKKGINKIGFAVILKFFQLEGFFPKKLTQVSETIVNYMAQEVGVSADLYQSYDLDSRNARNHKEQIREFTGFRSSTVEDANAIQAWLLSQSEVHDYTMEHLIEVLYQRYKDLKIEPPTPDRIDRLANSTLYTLEDRLFTTLFEGVPLSVRSKIDKLLEVREDQISLTEIKSDPGKPGLESLLAEIKKLQALREIVLPCHNLPNLSEKYLKRIQLRIATESLYETRRHPEKIRYALVFLYCQVRIEEIIDSLVELLISIIHKISASSERRVEKELLKDLKKVRGKQGLLYLLANTSLERPEGIIKEVIYPVVGEQTLKDIVREFQNSSSFQKKVYTMMRASYSHHYRRMVPEILTNLEFRSNNEIYRPVIQALELIQRYAYSQHRYYPSDEIIPIDGVVKKESRDFIIEKKQNEERINRINYEIIALQMLREKLRCKEIWVVGANRYRNPDEDLPSDFNTNRLNYYKALNQPLTAEIFTSRIEREMRKVLYELDCNMPYNNYVKILTKKDGWISLSPLEPQKEPKNLIHLKAELTRRWPMTSLIDILKETDFRVGFTKEFKGSGTRDSLDEETLQRRLLLCLFGIGTNTGLKRVCATSPEDSYQDLQYVRCRYIHRDVLRKAIAQVANAIFHIRLPNIWGECTTTCASDSKKFGAWDQNLLTEWHIRYRGRGVMIYWHVEKKATCIYSQLKSCSSSEVAAMIVGVLRHCTDMEIEKNYVDTHGQSTVGFAFCRLLNFQLMPRFKGIHKQKLYLPHLEDFGRFPNLVPILKRPINWELICQQYDQMVKYATALLLGTAEAESILKRFTRENQAHPTYKALCELGKAERTIFLCRYLNSEALRQEIQEGLNVIENWNSANGFIFYGKGGEFATNRLIDQEIAVLSLHLLQISMVYINTLMIQHVLSEKQWFEKFEIEDFRALTPLIYAHVNPYGTFKLNMKERIPIYYP